MTKHKVEIILPDTCQNCGGKLTVGKKKVQGGFTVIERPCFDCRKTDRFTIRTTFEHKHLQELKDLSI